MKIFKNYTLIIWIFSLIFTALSFTAHVISPSSWEQDEQTWEKRFELHQSDEVFRVRPITTAIIASLHDYFNLSYHSSFFMLQFFLLLISGPIFYFYLSALGFNFSQSLWGIILFYMSLPIFLAHFQPIYTWSDFWIYTMVPLAITSIIKKNWWLSSLTMFVALIARETSIIFIPLLFYLIHITNNKRYLKAILLSGIPVILFLIFRLIFFENSVGNIKLKWGFNFAGGLRSSDSIFSLLVSLGFLWLTGLWQAFRKSNKVPRFYTWLRTGAFLAVVAFTSSTLIFAQARESRLFFPSFIFLIPLSLIYFDDKKRIIKGLYRKLHPVLTNISLVILLSLSIILSIILFPEYEFRSWKDGNRFYLGLHFAVCMIFLLVEIRSRYLKNKINPYKIVDKVPR